LSVGLTRLEHVFETLVLVDPDADESALVERIAELEWLKSAAAAAQARITAALDGSRRSNEAARGVPAAKRGRGLGSEVALARRDSPNQGGQHLGFARALVHEMPHTLAAVLRCPDSSSRSRHRPPRWWSDQRGERVGVV
jgi:hypothetical protein